jgi:MTH538 TIR-like domain (DUF1863)
MLAHICAPGGNVSYRNKTYVIFDADNDRWAYAYMKGWKSNENMDFNFHDAHDIGPLTNFASDETIKARLRERFSNAKQAVVLVGSGTKNLRKWVPWEIEISQKLDLPIIVVNLDGKRQMNPDLCPLPLRNWPAVHVDYKAKIIQYALDNFTAEFSQIQASSSKFEWYYYGDNVYEALGL